MTPFHPRAIAKMNDYCPSKLQRYSSTREPSSAYNRERPPLLSRNPNSFQHPASHQQNAGTLNTYYHRERMSLEMSHRTQSSHRPAKSGGFRFMDLPAGRRINIHIKIFDGLPEAYLSTRTRKHLACRSALPRVSRHFRNDFIPILYLYSREIVSSVRDFNFGPVITFFNRLHDYEVKALLSVGTPSERKMTVALKLVDDRTAYETPYRITSLTR